jgi:hypothetical protein
MQVEPRLGLGRGKRLGGVDDSRKGGESVAFRRERRDHRSSAGWPVRARSDAARVVSPRISPVPSIRKRSPTARQHLVQESYLSEEGCCVPTGCSPQASTVPFVAPANPPPSPLAPLGFFSSSTPCAMRIRPRPASYPKPATRAARGGLCARFNTSSVVFGSDRTRSPAHRMETRRIL